MKKLVFLMTAAITMAACSSDNELLDNVGNGVSDKGEKVTVIATLPGGDTRVALQDVVDESGKNIIKVDWNESGERFTVMNTTDVMNQENETDYVFTQTEGDAFSGTLPTSVEGKPYYAFYPAIHLDSDNYVWYYDKNGDYVELTTFSPKYVPYDFSYQDGELNEANTLMYATSEDGEQFDFHHLTSIVKFTLTGLPKGLETSYIYLVFDGEVRPIHGYLDLTKETVEEIYLKTTDFGNEISIDTKGNVIADDGTYSFYAYLPPMDEGQSMSIYLMAQDEDNLYQCEASVKLTSKPIEAGKFYRATRQIDDMLTIPHDKHMTAGTVKELQEWVKAFQAGYYLSLTLTNDIDLTGHDLDGDPDNESNWIPFTLYNHQGEIIIDGAGHTITGMKVHTETEDTCASMFVDIDQNVVVKNIHLRNVDFYAKSNHAAGFARYNDGSIIGCSVTGKIQNDVGGFYASGIAYYNRMGDIIACWSKATLKAIDKTLTFGIVATSSNSTDIKSCFYNSDAGDAGYGIDLNSWAELEAIENMNTTLNEIEFGWHYEYDDDDNIIMVEGEWEDTNGNVGNLPV